MVQEIERSCTSKFDVDRELYDVVQGRKEFVVMV